MPDPVRLDYDPRPPRRRFFTRPVLVVLFLGLVFGGLQLWPLWMRARQNVGRMPCPEHLRQIGLAVSMYAVDHNGAFPDSLEAALLSGGLRAEALTCPYSSDTKPTGATPQQIAANIHAGGHCSYIYVGANLTSASPRDCIMAFEFPANHEMDGGNVAFADGHIDFMGLDKLVQIVPALEAGQNPPTFVTLTKAQATSLYAQRWLPNLSAMHSGRWEKTVTSRPTTQPTPASRPTILQDP